MDYLIRSKATGNPDQFAKKLEISRRTLLANLQEIKALGCSIAYCRTRECYYYTEEEETLAKIINK